MSFDNRMKKIWLPLLLLMLSVFVWVSANSSDRATIDDEQIKALLPVLDPTSNGMQYVSYLLENDNNRVSSEDRNNLREHIDFNAWDEAFVTRVLAELELHVSNIVLATNSSYIGFTPPDDSLDLLIFGQSVNLNRQLLLSSMAHLRSGNLDGAIAQLSISLRFSELIRRSYSSTLINYMVGDAMLFDTFRWAHHLALHPDFTEQQYQELLRAIKRVNNFASDGFRQVFAGEYIYVKHLFMGDGEWITERETFSGRLRLWFFQIKTFIGGDYDHVTSGDSISLIEVIFYDYTFDINDYLSHLASEYILLAGEAEKYCRNLTISSESYETAWYEFLLPKSKNKMLEQVGAVFSDYFNRRCLSYNYFTSVHAAIAVHAYEKKYGTTIEKVSLLIPEYLDKKPIDYMTGEALHYSYDDRWFFGSGVEEDNTEGSEEGIYNSSCKADEGCWSQPTIRLTPFSGEDNKTVTDGASEAG